MALCEVTDAVVVEVASAPTSGADKSGSDGGDTPTRVGYIAPAQETA